MPQMSEAFHAPTYSWLSKGKHVREVTLLHDSVKRLERASREQLALENESQGTFDHLVMTSATLKSALGALSRAVDEELHSVRSDVEQLREEVKTSIARERSSAATATQAVLECQRVLTELGASRRAEGEFRATREQLEALRAEHEDLKKEVVTLREQVRAAEEEGASTSAQIDQHRQAIQTVADMVSQNSAADEETAARMTERIDQIEKSLAGGGSGAEQARRLEAAEAEVAKLKRVIQHVADMVSQNSAADEETAARMTERLDRLEFGSASEFGRMDAPSPSLVEPLDNSPSASREVSAIMSPDWL